MIQIISYRDYFDLREQCWKTTHKVELQTRFETVGELFHNLDEVLSEIPASEHYNLHYTIANCFEAPRVFKSQTLIPVDIDDISEGETIDEYAAIVSEVLSIPFNEFIHVSSGHGVHFLFETDYSIQTKEELGEFQPAYKRLCELLKEAFKRAGLKGKIDHKIFRQSGTLRLPGTINRCSKKEEIQYPDTECVLIQKNYTLQSFSSLLGSLAVKESKDAIDSSSLRSFPTPDSDYVIKECRFLDWCFTSPAEVSEPEWYAALSIVGHLEDGNRLAHTMSQGHPGYSHRNTETKLSQAMASSGPRTCQNIDVTSDKCKSCPHFGKVTSPILLKGPDYISTAGSGFWTIGMDGKGNPRPIKPNYEDLRRYFQRRYQYVSTTSRQVWIYEAPIWREYKKSFLEEFAQENFNPKPTSGQVLEFVNLVLRTNVVTDSWFDDMSENKVNLSNGVIDMDTLEFHPHDKKFGFKYVLEHNYDQNATCPRFDKFMSEITLGRKELQDILLEYMAYAVSGMPYIYHKVLILSGEGSNGKSVFIHVLKSLVGTRAYSALLSNLFNSDYYRAMLVGKLFNVAEETPSAKTDSSYFKILSSGGTYQAREPYGHPILVQSSKTKLIMACNDLPEMSDFSEGFIRRLLIVPFDAKFDKKNADPRIQEKLSLELPGIFNRLIEAYRRLKVQDGFSQSTAVDQTIEEYKEMNIGAVVSFVEDKCEIGEPFKESCADFFTVFGQYCRDRGWKVETSNKVARDLKRFFKIQSKISRNEGKTQRIYPGLKLKDPAGAGAF